MDTKTKLKEILSKHIVMVNFTKKDGSERIMTCTLREDYVKPHVKKTERVKKINEEVLSVWDVDKDAFRSFKPELVNDYQIVQEGYEL